MGKANGVSRRRKKKFDYKVDRKKLHKKALALPAITCKQIQAAWDPKKSHFKNMKDMGLSANPNQTIRLKSVMEIDSLPGKKEKPVKAEKMEVAKSLEAEANGPKQKTFRLPTEVIKFCVYMIEKYGEDYKAMARDPKNYYQETPSQIKNRINKFKNIPQQWNGYLRAKGILTHKTKLEEYTIDVNEIMTQ